MSTDIGRLFGERVKAERTARGWSLRDLAGRTGGLAASTIQRAESGKIAVQLEVAVRIARAFGMPLGDLVDTAVCERCYGEPAAGFICGRCGRIGGAP